MITAADLSFDGHQIKSVSEAVFESGFAKPEVAQFHNVVTEIVAKKQIAILGRISGLVGAGSGGCDPSAASNTITNTEKFWDPVMVSDRFTFCWTTLQDTFFIWGLKQGINKADLTSTDFLIWVQELVVDAIWECVYRIVWFSDVDADDVAASPPGVLTSGTTLAYFNKIDGFWKQIFAIVAADATKKTTGLASRNGQATYALQEFTTTDITNLVVTSTLKNMKYGADMRLRNDMDKVYIATQSVVDQLEREYDSKAMVFTLDRLENGMSVFKSSGIEVIAFDFWDRIIRTYYDNGTKYYLPHRVVLINPENLQVGTEGSTALNELDIHYDRTTKKTHIDFAFSIDAKLILDYAVQVAY